jgi:hypothetical protein
VWTECVGAEAYSRTNSTRRFTAIPKEWVQKLNHLKALL